MSELQAFREEVRGWLGEHCPEGARGEGDIHLGTTKKAYHRDVDAWLDIMAERAGRYRCGLRNMVGED